MEKTEFDEKDFPLSFDIEDLGPIKKANINLGNLTLLFGYPNTGKSYAMRAIYGALSIFNEYESNKIKDNISNDLADLLLKNLSNQLDNIIKGVILNISNQIFNYLDKKFKEPKFIKILESTNLKEALNDFKNFLNREGIPKKINFDVEIKKNDVYDIINNAIQKNISLLVNWGKTSSIKINNKHIDKIFSENDILFKAINEKKGTVEIKLPAYILFDLFFDTKLVRYLQDLYFLVLRKINFSLKIDIGLSYLTQEKIKFSLEIIISEDSKELEEIFNFLDQRYLNRNIPIRLSDSAFNAILYLLKNFKNLLDLEKRKLYSHESSLFRNIINSVANEFGTIFINELKYIFNYTLHVSSAKFIPYGRNLTLDLLSEMRKGPILELNSNRILLKDIKEVPFWSYFKLMDREIMHLEDEKNDVRDLFIPVLGGHVKLDKANQYIKYEYATGKYVSIGLSSAMVGEISGIMLPLLSMGENEVILIEEPEAQLHYSSQVLIGLILIAISKIKNSKIIITTHSDILPLIINQVLSENPSKEQIFKLIKKIIKTNKKTINKYIDNLADKVAINKEDFKINYYYFKPNEDVIKINNKDLEKCIPGLTEVYEELLNWSYEVFSQKNNTFKK
ncbi:MAG: hypothetical protein ACP5IB_08205 [Thermoplasmata archaeon]